VVRNRVAWPAALPPVTGTDHARVEIDGEPQDVTAFQTVHLGL
jgi:hypothetical protein